MKHGHPPVGDPPEILAFADSIVRGGDLEEAPAVSSPAPS
jgi:hypothetical protein